MRALRSATSCAERREHGEQREVVMEVGVVVELGHRLGDVRARPTQEGCELVHPCLDVCRWLDERRRRHDRHPELGESLVSGRRQVEPPGNILAYDGTDDDVEEQLEVGRAAPRAVPGRP